MVSVAAFLAAAAAQRAAESSSAAASASATSTSLGATSTALPNINLNANTTLFDMCSTLASNMKSTDLIGDESSASTAVLSDICTVNTIKPAFPSIGENCANANVSYSCTDSTNYYFPAAGHLAMYGTAFCDALDTNNTLTLRPQNKGDVGEISSNGQTEWNDASGLAYTGINMALTAGDNKVRYNFWAYSQQRDEDGETANRWYGCRQAVAQLQSQCFINAETPGGYTYQSGRWEDGFESYRVTIDYISTPEPYNAPFSRMMNSSTDAFNLSSVPDHIEGNGPVAIDFKCHAEVTDEAAKADATSTTSTSTTSTSTSTEPTGTVYVTVGVTQTTTATVPAETSTSTESTSTSAESTTSTESSTSAESTSTSTSAESTSTTSTESPSSTESATSTSTTQAPTSSETSTTSSSTVKVITITASATSTQ